MSSVTSLHLLAIVSEPYIIGAMPLNTNLKAAREYYELSQEQVGALFDPVISREAVSQWEKLDKPTIPKMAKLKVLAQRYNTTVEALISDIPWSPASKGYTVPKLNDQFVLIPAYEEIQAGMGRGVANGLETVTDKHSYSQNWLEKNGLDPTRLRRIRGRGRSMEPTIFDGDMVLINLDEKKIVDGKVYAFRVDDEIRIKRLYRQLDGRVRVASDNPDKTTYPDEYLSINDMPELIGRVRDRSGTTNL